MLFERLELNAYGCFSNEILDFATPGLHIVYGLNETGKSTVRRAINAILFGIPERTQDAYIHNPDKLRLGAKLSQQQEIIHFYRRKGRKNTLLSHNNEPLNESKLQHLLNGITEAQYNALFCLNHEQLVQGGEDLLNNGGEVGRSLFEAGSGGLKIHEVLISLEQEAEELFKHRGSKPKLNQAIQDYRAAMQKKEQNTLLASKYKDHDNRINQAKKEQQQLNQQLQILRSEEARLARIQRSRPLLNRYKDLEQKLKELQEVVLLPDAAKSKRLQAHSNLLTAAAQVEHSSQLIQDLQQQLQDINISYELISRKDTIENLLQQLGSHSKAARDLPGVRTECRSNEQEAQQLLQRIYPNYTLVDLAKLAITEQQREKIKILADNYPSLHEKQVIIDERLSKLIQQQLQLQQEFNDLPDIPDISELKAVLNKSIKQGDLEQELAKDSKEINILTLQAEIELKQLGLWTGSLEELELITLPKLERIDLFERRFRELENDRQRIKEKLLDARQRYTQAGQKIDAIRWAGEVPTEAMLEQARQERDQYWQRLKHAQLSPELALSFEQKIRKADDLADRLRREANRVTEQANYMAEREAAKYEQEIQAQKWRKSEELLHNLQNEWEQAWLNCNLKPWTPAEMRTWLGECNNLRHKISVLRERKQNLTQRQQLITELCQELSSKLPNSTQISLIDLIEQAQNEINSVLQSISLRDNLKRQIKITDAEVQNLRAQQHKHNQDISNWQQQWQQAIQPLALTDDTRPEILRSVLDILDRVFNKLDKINGLSRRIKRMEEDALNFKTEVNTVLADLMPDLLGQAVDQTIPKLVKYLNQNEKDATKYAQLEKQLHTEQIELNQALAQQQTAKAIIDALLKQAHCKNLAELEQAEQLSSQKADYMRLLSDTEQNLAKVGDGMSIAELEADANNIEINTLPSLLLELQQQIHSTDKQRSELDQTIGGLSSLLAQMNGNNAAAVAAAEAQEALAQMQDLSERYLQVSLAASVLRKSIENYRKRHQAPLLSRASELFKYLTLNSFVGLEVAYNQKDQAIILGSRANGTGVETSFMSDGSRDQLYFALRLASIELYLQLNPALPLVLDDILINFDDLRAKASLDLLAKLSHKTQILFFTHHQRLVELAQNSGHPLYLHELQSS